MAREHALSLLAHIPMPLSPVELRHHTPDATTENLRQRLLQLHHEHVAAMDAVKVSEKQVDSAECAVKTAKTALTTLNR